MHAHGIKEGGLALLASHSQSCYRILHSGISDASGDSRDLLRRQAATKVAG